MTQPIHRPTCARRAVDAMMLALLGLRRYVRLQHEEGWNFAALPAEAEEFLWHENAIERRRYTTQYVWLRPAAFEAMHEFAGP